MSDAGNKPNFVGLAGQLVGGSIQENLFIKGEAFSYEDWLIYGAAETKTFVFDPTACTCDQILFDPFIFAATSGPIEIQIYHSTIADDDGTLLGASNRRATSPNVNEGILRLNPSNITLGTRFSGDLVASTGLNSSTSTGGSNARGLPFEVTKAVKYALTIKNTDGAGCYVQFKTTWFEVHV